MKRILVPSSSPFAEKLGFSRAVRVGNFVSVGGTAPMDDHDWSIVLLDHEPPPRRGVDAARLRERSQLIIGHDSEHPAYGYDQAFEQFKYKFTYSRMTPWTTVVSDTDPLDWLDDALKHSGDP